MEHVCRICANAADNPVFRCAEKMFGFGGEFIYFQCGRCGCLQTRAAPADLSRYYPPHYYSFHVQAAPQQGWKAQLAGGRDYWLLSGRGADAWFARRLAGHPALAALRRLPLRAGMTVLDVGCGRGQLLSILYRTGFRGLLGVDPFLPADSEVVPGVRVCRQPLESLEQSFDLIMFHHVFEHIEDGRGILSAACGRLRPNGRILLRLPTVESAAWERYRENWVGLDAPRHFFLHTRRSLELLAGQAGLAVERCWCDSAAFQFWASELYQSGQPLVSAEGRTAQAADHFTLRKLRAFAREARTLNAAGRGDNLAVVLVSASRQYHHRESSAGASPYRECLV